MNEPIDHKHEDEQISALYRSVSAEQPPSHLDDAILAAVNREVRSKPRALAPFSTRWTLPFSLAAVIVLSVSVVTLVPKESTMEIESRADLFSDTAEAPRPRKEEKVAALKREAAAPSFEPESSAAIAKPNTEAPMEETEPRERLAERPALLISPTRDNEAGIARSGLPAELMADESAAGSAAQPSVAEASRLAESPMEEQKAIADRETTVATAADQTPDQSPQPPSSQMLGFTAKPAVPQEKQKPALAQSQPPSPKVDLSQLTAKRAVASATTASDAVSCALLSAKDCLQSPKCTYILGEESAEEEKSYLCRDAANRCEQSFDQLLGNKQSCENKPGCRFIPGYCECPEGQLCDCREKNPPQCTF